INEAQSQATQAALDAADSAAQSADNAAQSAAHAASSATDAQTAADAASSAFLAEQGAQDAQAAAEAAAAVMPPLPSVGNAGKALQLNPGGTAYQFKDAIFDDGAGKWDAKGHVIKSGAAAVVGTDIPTLAQVQGLIGGSGSVPPPVAGDV